MSVPTTISRVPHSTAAHVNDRIRQAAAARVREYAQNRQDIPRRLERLKEEWDVERVIETNAAALAFAGVALGYFVHPAWLLLPALVTAFLLQHAIQGWCPPIPILRRMGYRTVYEIDQERYALKALRGDFNRNAGDEVETALAATGLR